MREILDAVDDWRRHGERLAVATVLATGGSTPRPTGAKMAITASGKMAGSISGGCVDTDVIEHAIEVLRSGRPQIVEYGFVPDMSWEIGLMCGGSVQVYIEPLEPGMAGAIEDNWLEELVEQSGEAACAI
jgi:xanthine/CO dehydrogenase XdhC/CoxF family maturation factor